MPLKVTRKIQVGLFDVVVIGGGSAGVEAALAAVVEGAAVCLVEADRLGGECPHWACVPTKVMLHAAQTYHHAKFSMAHYGIDAQHVSFNFARLMARKDAVVQTISSGKEAIQKLLSARGVVVRLGQKAFFTGKYTLAVGEERIRAKAFVIATGSGDAVPPIAGIKDASVLFSREVVSLKHLPKSIAIVGGGPVGTEFATFFRLLGVPTTLIESGAQILPHEDGEIALLAAKELSGGGVSVLLQTKLLSVSRDGQRLKLTVQTGKRPRQSFLVDKLMLAAGRRPNVDQLLLAKAGESHDFCSAYTVDETLRLNAPQIFYAGDAAGGAQFTAVAGAQGNVAGANAARLAFGRTDFVDYKPRALPRVTFTSPEIASVGLTAKEAVAQGRKIKIAHGQLGQLGRSVIAGKRYGLLKIIVDQKSDLILGAHLMGEHAGEVIHELALAIEADIPYLTVAGMLHAYPTYSEGIPLALGELL